MGPLLHKFASPTSLLNSLLRETKDFLLLSYPTPYIPTSSFLISDL